MTKELSALIADLEFRQSPSTVLARRLVALEAASERQDRVLKVLLERHPKVLDDLSLADALHFEEGKRCYVNFFP